LVISGALRKPGMVMISQRAMMIDLDQADERPD